MAAGGQDFIAEEVESQAAAGAHYAAVDARSFLDRETEQPARLVNTVQGP